MSEELFAMVVVVFAAAVVPLSVRYLSRKYGRRMFRLRDSVRFVAGLHRVACLVVAIPLAASLLLGWQPSDMLLSTIFVVAVAPIMVAWYLGAVFNRIDVEPRGGNDG